MPIMVLAELVAQNGPSAPAWAFFTALSLGVLTLIGQQLKTRADLKLAKAQLERTSKNVDKAVESANQAQENTASLSNGFAGGVLGKLDRIIETQQTTDDALRKHLEWHLNRETK